MTHRLLKRPWIVLSTFGSRRDAGDLKVVFPAVIAFIDDQCLAECQPLLTASTPDSHLLCFGFEAHLGMDHGTSKECPFMEFIGRTQSPT